MASAPVGTSGGLAARNSHAPSLFVLTRFYAGICSGFYLGIEAIRPFPRAADAVGRIGAEKNIQDLAITDDPWPVLSEFLTAFFATIDKSRV